MPYPNDVIKILMKSYSSVYHCLEIIKHEADRLQRNNGGIVGRGEILPFVKRQENIPKSPIQHPPTETKLVYNSRDFSFPTNFQPAVPITPLSPLVTTVPFDAQNQQNIEEDRKRSNQQQEIEWSKHQKRGSTSSLDSNNYNEQLKKIDFILARNFHSMNGEKIGFPVCDSNKELLGFFRESEVGEGKFYPVSVVENYDPRMTTEVKRTIDEAINQRSDAVHRLKDCGGQLASLFDHAMVYDWSREFSQQS